MREMLRKAMLELGKKAYLKSQDLWKLNIRLQKQSVFQRIHLSDIVLGVAGRHIPEKNLNRNIFKNNTTKKY
jgi:hypothetical protein